MNTMKRAASAAAVAGLAAGFASAASAQQITLQFGHFWPTGAGPHADMAIDWTNQVTECTDGQVQFEFHTSGSQLGAVTRLEDHLRAGLLDIAHGLNHFPRGRFTAATVIDTPNLARSSYANANTLWSLYEEGLLAETYAGLHMLALHAHPAGHLHTRGQAVRLPSDVSGMRIRTPSPSMIMAVESMGGTAVGVPPGETYEVLARGTADGTVFPYEAVFGFGLAEVLDFHTEVGFYTTSFWFAMNENTFNNLPENVQACVNEASGRSLVQRIGAEYWPSWDIPGLEAAQAAGNEIIHLTEEERAAWTEHFIPVAEQWLDSLEAEGVDNAREIYARAQELVAQYEAAWQARSD